jgi:hypothetical protein
MVRKLIILWFFLGLPADYFSIRKSLFFGNLRYVIWASCSD